MAGAATRDAAMTLAQCLQDFAARRSNPVLAVLDTPDRIVIEQKYPDGGLRFHGNRVRAYYHVHNAPGKPAAEHGHFHIFIRVGAGDDPGRDWSHLVALSMDGYGQPLQWFTVNHWVTAGQWVDAPVLASRLATLEPDASDGAVQTWLAAMVGLYQREIASLLQQRDARLIGINAGSNETVNIREDRNLYMLGSGDVRLLATLEAALAAPST
jgi:hypothetical protein